ncbi:PAS domain-containing protein [Kitasatospora sp. NPDC048722]|uniref:PAS domain-containing protein n=1 Tax=Kitasatospora sp. NPDC048722 TaxID=3155639 RepID=UPI0033C1E3C1
MVDPDGVVSGWSEAGLQLLGWTAEETVGRHVADFLVDPPPGFPGNDGPGPAGLIAVRHRGGSVVDAAVTAGRQRARHQRDQARPTAHQAAADPEHLADLRGLRRQ